MIIKSSKLKMIKKKLLLFSILTRIKKLRSKITRRKRRYEVHPMNSAYRKYFGYYEARVPILRKYEDKFIDEFSMDYESFDMLYTMIGSSLEKTSDKAFSPEMRIYVTLKFLITGDSPTSIAQQFMIGKTTVFKIIYEVCEVIVTELGSEFIELPDSCEKWKSIASEYMKKRGFPHVLGSCDGKHVTIVCPDNSGSLCYNYKNAHSIVLFAVCDANSNLLYAQCGSLGRESDGGIYNRSEFKEFIESQKANIPEAEPIIEDGPSIPYYFLGDNAFKNYNRMLTPKSGVFLTEDWLNYNKRHSSARITIEQFFGILSSRFKILRRPIYVDLKQINNVVMACCVLHNFIRQFAAHLDDAFIDSFSNNDTCLVTNDEDIINQDVTEDLNQVKDYLKEILRK